MATNDRAYYSPENMKIDDIRAVDAKVEAQKIAFSPLTFQAIRAALELGIVRTVSDAGSEGISVQEIAKKCEISEYGAGVLCEMALGMGVLRFSSDSVEDAEKYVLGKTGFFLLEDD